MMETKDFVGVFLLTKGFDSKEFLADKLLVLKNSTKNLTLQEMCCKKLVFQFNVDEVFSITVPSLSDFKENSILDTDKHLESVATIFFSSDKPVIKVIDKHTGDFRFIVADISKVRTKGISVSARSHSVSADTDYRREHLFEEFTIEELVQDYAVDHFIDFLRTSKYEQLYEKFSKLKDVYDGYEIDIKLESVLKGTTLEELIDAELFANSELSREFSMRLHEDYIQDDSEELFCRAWELFNLDLEYLKYCISPDLNYLPLIIFKRDRRGGSIVNTVYIEEKENLGVSLFADDFYYSDFAYEISGNIVTVTGGYEDTVAVVVSQDFNDFLYNVDFLYHLDFKSPNELVMLVNEMLSWDLSKIAEFEGFVFGDITGYFDFSLIENSFEDIYSYEDSFDIFAKYLKFKDRADFKQIYKIFNDSFISYEYLQRLLEATKSNNILDAEFLSFIFDKDTTNFWNNDLISYCTVYDYVKFRSSSEEYFLNIIKRYGEYLNFKNITNFKVFLEKFKSPFVAYEMYKRTCKELGRNDVTFEDCSFLVLFKSFAEHNINDYERDYKFII